jgi:hypothetical protein
MFQNATATGLDPLNAPPPANNPPAAIRHPGLSGVHPTSGTDPDRADLTNLNQPLSRLLPRTPTTNAFKVDTSVWLWTQR